jgi:hypothetical protein
MGCCELRHLDALERHRRDRTPDSESMGFFTYPRRARAPISTTADPTAAVLATAYAT